MKPKYRAWYGNRRMLQGFPTYDPEENKWYMPNDYGSPKAFEIDPRYLMQSTNLKDKNGVEIYEGDILPSNYNVFSKGELKVQVVRFLDGGFRTLSVYQEWGSYGAYGEAEIADWHDGRCLSEEVARKTKVLGNIYENPELLEENTK